MKPKPTVSIAWLLLASFCFTSVHAEEKPTAILPDWYARDNFTGSKTEFMFTVSIDPQDRLAHGWDVNGWTEIHALMTPRKNGPFDTTELALSHRFRADLPRLGRPDHAWPLMYPRLVVFPPAYIDGKEYFLPIHGHLFQCGEPLNHRDTTFKWISPSKTPKGIPPVRLDSLCIPQKYKHYPAELNFVGSPRFGVGVDNPGALPYMQLVVTSIAPNKDEKTVWEAEVECECYPFGARKRGTVTVREGNILVLPEYGGFVVRHIVPFDTNTRAIGWVDLDCHIIEEKDLEARAEDECREIVRFEMKSFTVTVENKPTPEPTKKQTSVPSKETTLMPEWIRLVAFILVPLAALGVWILLILRHRRRVSGL